MQRIRELDGLRAIAILGVLLAHFTHGHGAFANLMYLGWSGVDLFFAISGFLITSILIGLREHEAPFKTFYWRRTLRIFPAYYLSLSLILILASVHHERIDFVATLRYWLFLSSARLGLIRLAFSRLLLHSPVASLAYSRITAYSILGFKDCLGIYWSLSVEELFYLIWAPVILKGSRKIVLFCSIAPFLLCPLLRALVHTTPHIDEMAGFVFRFDSLAAGGCVALLFWAREKGHLKVRLVDRCLILTIVLSSLALLLLSVSCGVFKGADVRTTMGFSVFGYSLLGVFCASVVGACARWSGNLPLISRILRSGVAVYLGTVSYTIYLIHLPVYVFVQLMIHRSLGHYVIVGAGSFSVLSAILSVGCTVALAALSWRYFETPILRLREKRFSMRKPLRAAGPTAQAAAI